MANYTVDQLFAKLERADAAGDTEAAKAIADEIRRVQKPSFGNVKSGSSTTERAPVERADPAEGMSTVDRIRSGFGKSFVDTAQGVKQAVTESAGRHGGILAAGLRGIGLQDASDAVVSGVVAPSLRMQQEQQAEIDERRRLDAPLMDTAGGFGGNIAGQVTQMAIPVGGAATRGGKLLQAAAQGGAFAGAQPVLSGESRGANTAEGAAWGLGGQAVASGLGRLAQSAGSKLSEPVRQSIELARRAGIPLNLAQVTESPALKAAVAASKWLPFSGAGKSARNQQEAFNRALSRSMGADAPALTDDVMRGARQKIGGVFEDIYSRNDVPLTPDALRKLASIENDAARRLTADEAQVLRNQVDDILANAEDGALTGQKYQAVRTMLQRAEGPDKVGASVKELRKALDDIAAQSISPEDAAALAKSRGQWANMRVIEDALKQVGGAGGNVRPSALWPLIRKGSTREMRELAKIGQNVLKEGVGDSGTAQRQFYTSLLAGGGAASVGALPLLAKAIAGGAVAGRALNSNMASKLLQQGKPTAGLARLSQGAPRALPVVGPRLAELLGLGAVGGQVLTPEEEQALQQQMR